MEKEEDGRRVVARAITFIDEKILLIERFRREGDSMLHYYTIPGGGVMLNEDYQEAAVRETKEETCCDVVIKKALTKEDYPNGRCYWFYAEYLKGTPTLGGEELEHNNPDNSFKVVLIDYSEINNINILGMGKKLIKECFENYYKKELIM